MMRSMYAGVSGLRTHQTKMDVIGNNIANVNTVGYKSQSIVFSDLMYQTTQAASGANAETGRGGINARQIGLGSKAGAISTAISSPGASQSTGNPFDIQIAGDSFFIVSDGANNYFTRSGAFYIDGAGNLAMTSNGYTVQGWQADNATQTIIKDRVSTLKVMSAANMTSDAEATTLANITGILDKFSEGFTNGQGVITTIGFFDNLGYSYTAKMKFTEVMDGGTPPEPRKGFYKLEVADILDSSGKSISKTAAYGYNPADPATEATALQTMLDTLKFGNGVAGDNSMIVEYDTGNGNFKGVYNNLGAGGTWPPAPTTDKTFQMNLNNLVNEIPGFTGMNIQTNMGTTINKDNKGSSTIAGEGGELDTGRGKGRRVGKMSKLSVDGSGKIFAAYDNGQNRLLGQIAVASFANPSGLMKEGDNLYSATQNSGEFDGIGQDVTAGGEGSMTTGVLEMSNVDLSSEFTEMITTQRGFQANSRIITVSDTLLEELINLKR